MCLPVFVLILSEFCDHISIFRVLKTAVYLEQGCEEAWGECCWILLDYLGLKKYLMLYIDFDLLFEACGYTPSVGGYRRFVYLYTGFPHAINFFSNCSLLFTSDLHSLEHRE